MFFLYNPATSRTGRALGRALGASRGYPSRWERLGAQSDALVRWGSSSGNDAPITINTRQAVENAANKLRMLELLRDGGINVPAFSTNWRDLEYPFLGRSRNHRGGSDIVIYMGDDTPDPSGHAFFTEFVESTHEIRFHVLGGEVIRAQIKEGPRHEGHLPIRNHDHGFRFVPYVNSRPHAHRSDAAIEAVRCLGLDFGSVDVLCGVDSSTVVLEVNSSAGCSRPTAGLYARGIAQLLQNKGIEIPRLNEGALDVLSPD